MRYQPSLDALRGLSVAAVFVYHAGYFNGGWIGVQIFFVLSGYLITGILDESLRNGASAASYFGNFYVRRALRIFPVYFAYIAATLLLVRPALAPLVDDPNRIATDEVPYLLTYTYNLYKAFNPQTDIGILFGHLWSLSIEEQFYLAWPLLLFCLHRRRFVGLCLALIVAGPLVRAAEAYWQWQPGLHAREFAGRFVYFFTLSHFDAFAAGALVHFAKTEEIAARIIGHIAKYGLWIALGLGAWMLLLARMGGYNVSASSLGWPIYLPYSSAYAWGFTVLNFVGVALIVHNNRLPAPLNNFAVRHLGRVSYGFYIFHFIVLWAIALVSGVRTSPSFIFHVAIAMVAFFATWLLAAASYRFIETPFLRLKRQFAPRKLESEPAE